MNGAFDGSNALKTLFLHNNPDLELDENASGLNRLTSLITYSLSGCSLKSVPNGLLKNMT